MSLSTKLSSLGLQPQLKPQKCKCVCETHSSLISWQGFVKNYEVFLGPNTERSFFKSETFPAQTTCSVSPNPPSSGPATLSLSPLKENARPVAYIPVAPSCIAAFKNVSGGCFQLQLWARIVRYFADYFLNFQEASGGCSDIREALRALLVRLPGAQR